MTEKKTQHADVTVLSIQQIFSLLLRRFWVLLLSAAICGAACYYISSNFITPKYESTVTFYVNNNSFSTDNRLSYSDLWVSQNLVDTYMVILETGDTMRAVIQEAGVDLTVTELEDMIQAKMVEQTELFGVTVTGLEPESTFLLAQAIGEVLPERIGNIMDGTSAKVADYALRPTSPSDPSPARNAVSGAMFGFVFGASVLLLWALLTFWIRKEEDITRMTTLPILASVPAMALTGKDGKRRKKNLPDWAKVGKSMTDQAAESMQTLCLKLPFCFADDHGCRVIGISSAMAGEGKSTTAVNLAYSLAKLRNRVLLVDCDLRRPSVHIKLEQHQKPGLSDYLVGRVSESDIIRDHVSGNVHFSVVVAGRIPPNPIELLSADRMRQLLESLEKIYDYMILDLPPVGEVGDAIVAAKLTDGNLLVVRQGHCTRPALQAAIHEFDSVDAKLLGIIHNCVK